jgi:hypothetical protein
VLDLGLHAQGLRLILCEPECHGHTQNDTTLIPPSAAFDEGVCRPDDPGSRGQDPPTLEA